MTFICSAEKSWNALMTDKDVVHIEVDIHIQNKKPIPICRHCGFIFIPEETTIIPKQ